MTNYTKTTKGYTATINGNEVEIHKNNKLPLVYHNAYKVFINGKKVGEYDTLAVAKAAIESATKPEEGKYTKTAKGYTAQVGTRQIEIIKDHKRPLVGVGFYQVKIDGKQIGRYNTFALAKAAAKNA